MTFITQSIKNTLIYCKSEVHFTVPRKADSTHDNCLFVRLSVYATFDLINSVRKIRNPVLIATILFVE